MNFLTALSPPGVPRSRLAAGRAPLRAIDGAGFATPWPILALFVLTWMLVPLVARWPAVIWDDTMESWTWGQVPELGYYKLPPFYAWIAGLWFRVLPLADWSGYLLSSLAGAVGLVGLWHISSRLVAERLRIAALLLATTLPTATFMATLFNANTILLALWPWTVLALLRSLERRRAVDGVLLGLLAAAAMLSKYSSALLFLSMLAAALLHPDRRAWLRSPAPYAAVLVGGLSVAPHVAWLVANDFPTFKYAAGKVTDSTARALWKALTVSLTTVGLALTPAIGLAIGLRGRTRAALLQSWRRLSAPQLRWWLALGLGPAVLTILSGIVGGVGLTPNYLIPTLFLVPLLLVAGCDSNVGERLEYGARQFAAGYATVALVSAPLVALSAMALDVRKFPEPAREATVMAQQLWHERVGRPVGIVAGSELYALALAYYGPDRPVQFTHLELRDAPWITPERIASAGLLAICIPGDPDCPRLAPWLTQATIREKRVLQKTFLGVGGRPVELEFVLIPPVR